MRKIVDDEVARFLLALQFLTRLPTPRDVGFTPERLGAATRYFPLIGVFVGAISAGVFYAASLVFPIVLAVLLATAAGLLATGAFHEDGLADTFDGIGGGVSRDRALEIMKDSRIGVYGAAALILVLAIKVGTLSVLDQHTILIALISAHGLSRFSSVVVIATSRYVRDDGTGKHTSRGIDGAGLIGAIFTAGLCLTGVTYFLSPVAALWSVVGLCAGHIFMRAIFERKLSGYTGDTLGAVQQTSEIGFYFGLAAWA